MVGSDITSTAAQLQKTTEEKLYFSLRNPKPEIDALIRQLRIVYQIDPKQYTIQKKALPYFVCGIFNPPYRRTENFAYTESFIIDIDKLSCKQMELENVRQRIIADDRVLMCFASPSKDGLKVMFRLKERCYDSGLYSIFYKTFAREFAVAMGLEQLVDERTSDVTRACFVSIDPDAYYNAACTPVNLSQYADASNPYELFGQKQVVEMEANEAIQVKEAEEKPPADPSQEIMDKIKQRLNPKAQRREKERREVYVPDILNQIIDELVAYLQDTGLAVQEIINIQYAKKIRVAAGLKQAEVNLFYGRRGFTVVQSPRCGTSNELNEAVAALIEQFIAEYGS